MREPPRLDMSNSKICRRCRVIRPLDSFRTKKRKRKDGTHHMAVQSWCLECERANARDYYHRRPVQSIHSLGLEALPIGCDGNRQGRPRRHPITFTAKAQVAARVRTWRARHPGKARSYAHNRRACEGNYTELEWKALSASYGNRCIRCGVTDGAGGNKLSIDHVVPISAGGTNWIWNIQPLCLTCNISKHARTEDWRTDGIYLRMVDPDGTVHNLGSHYFLGSTHC